MKAAPGFLRDQLDITKVAAFLFMGSVYYNVLVDKLVTA
jgi:hypothetical protein